MLYDREAPFELKVTKVIDEKEATEKRLWNYYKYLRFTELKEANSEVSNSKLFLI